MIKTIEIKCDTKDSLSIDDISPFQGALKSLSTENYAKLKTEILTTGFAFPLGIWKNDGKNNCLGGHQRLRVLIALRQEGYLVPPVPVIYIECKDYAEAKRRVLQDASSYGFVETQGLYEFAVDAGLSLPALEAFPLPDLDMKSFGDEFFNTPIVDTIKEKELDENIETKNECPSCGYHW